MALLFLDSFDHYTDLTTLVGKWGQYGFQSFSGGPPTGIIPTGGRNGTGYLQMQYSGCQYGSYYYLGWPLPTPRNIVIVGFALKWHRMPDFYEFQTLDFTGNPYDFHFLTFGNHGGGICGLKVSAGNYITIDAGGGGGLITTPGPVVPDDQWFYIEVKVNTNNNQVTLRINNAIVIDGILSIGGGPIDTVFLGHLGGKSSFANFPQWQYNYDDVYVADTVGGNVTDFLGDLLVLALVPAAAGSNSAWQPFPLATPNWDTVNDASPNGDVDNVNTDVAGTIDTYHMEAIAQTNGAIKGVQYVFNARKFQGGSRFIAPVVRMTGGSPVQTVGNSIAPGISYSSLKVMHELNPRTGVAWTVADFNSPNAEHGIQLVS